MKVSSRKGRYNSSATRIRPFFEALVASDPTGVDWLSKLLALPGPQSAFSDELVRGSGSDRLDHFRDRDTKGTSDRTTGDISPMAHPEPEEDELAKG
jgi:hypothetical protein